MNREEAVLLGRQGSEEITADELAEKMGTINYEIVCMIAAGFPEFTRARRLSARFFSRLAGRRLTLSLIPC